MLSAVRRLKIKAVPVVPKRQLHLIEREVSACSTTDNAWHWHVIQLYSVPLMQNGMTQSVLGLTDITKLRKAFFTHNEASTGIKHFWACTHGHCPS